jgi:hypothetical protein
MQRFARLGIGGPKRSFDPEALPPEIARVVEAGIADAWEAFDELKKAKIDTGELTSAEMLGTREQLKNDYLNRMGGAISGIYGNTKEEAMYPIYNVDADGKPLSGENRYSLRFAPGQLPPVNAFWSLTMYSAPDILLVDNPINRHLLNSPMLEQFKRDDDGGLTLIVLHEAPDKQWEANWLPAPKGPFTMAMRLYWPKREATEGTWTAPPLKRLP